jgi:hypothetical protein
MTLAASYSNSTLSGENENARPRGASILIRIRRWLFSLIVLILICTGIVAVIYGLIELRPQYIELAIPAPEGGQASNFDVHSIWEMDSPGGEHYRYFIWRQGYICPISECNDWNTLMAYFDEWLQANGWKREIIGDHCYGTMTEAQFLEKDETDGYVAYQPTHPENRSSFVCLAVWPDDQFYYITLMTRNSSFFTQLRSSWD